MDILERINGHDDLIQLDAQSQEQLCDEIRDFLVSHVAKTGGHLASNLGVVELTVAIETIYNTNVDRLVFDVGHQAYVHKLLTGRRTDFDHLRQFGGMAGFPKPGESVTDAFVAGHASSSVSIALGMARARTLQKQNYHIVAVLGDGAATGGMVYEGLNDAADSGEPMVIILNDNEMSIDKNVGGLSKHLSRLRTKERYLGMKNAYRSFLNKLPGGKTVFRVTRNVKDRVRRMLLPETLFENMGLEYLGPVDGHDLPELLRLLQLAKDMNKPVLLHVLTQKGHGYLPAENSPSKFHGVGKFNPETGEIPPKNGETFSDAFGGTMLSLAAENSKICAITAAMPGGTGLLDFKKFYPKRLFDVGIAEEHAVSMAGGLAKQGMVPVVALYSTFLQRAYDQLMQDVALLKLHVVFAVDRAGLVGEDGETHHGVFDVGFLRQIPGMQLLCPLNCAELSDMLCWAVLECSGPVAIRYPRGGDCGYSLSNWKQGPIVCHRQGKDITLVTYGTMLKNVMDAAQILSAHGIEATVLRLLSLNPLPVEELLSLKTGNTLAVIEETAAGSGIYEALSSSLHDYQPQCRVFGMNLGCGFVTHGTVQQLYSHYGLDENAIANKILEVLPREN